MNFPAIRSNAVHAACPCANKKSIKHSVFYFAVLYLFSSTNVFAAGESGGAASARSPDNASVGARLATLDARIAANADAMARALHDDDGIHARLGAHDDRLDLHASHLATLDESMGEALHGENGVHTRLDGHAGQLASHGAAMSEQGEQLAAVADAQRWIVREINDQGDDISSLGKDVGAAKQSINALDERVAGVARKAVTVPQLEAHGEWVGQNAVAQSQKYTDQKVGEIRGDIRRMDRSFRKGIASVAALQMTTPYAPGRVAVNAGTALYRGQGAVALGVSYWNTAGDLNINAGVATAGGNSTVVRAGIGYLF